MLRYYYSSFWSINQYGGSFFKPLFFEFPSDPNTYNDIEINMLLGNSLKASVEVRRLPNEADGKKNETAFYFPNGTWC
jgi:alpha-glucosidase (family GH31 glycosyl hydrolase)